MDKAIKAASRREGGGMRTREDYFSLASRAFDLFTLEERKLALVEFAKLRCPHVEDRFFEAVQSVIDRVRKAKVGV